MTITTDLYLTYIRKALKDSIRTADIMNKMALETKAITLDQYRAAAQVIVKAYKEQNW